MCHYLTVLKTYIVQQIQDTIWLDDQATTPLFDAGLRPSIGKPMVQYNLYKSQHYNA
jgi:hypothetical protein